MKKYGVLIGLAALLLVAVYVNIRVNKNALDAPLTTPAPTTAGEVLMQNVTEGGDFFAVFRTDRENTRAKELEYLETIILLEQTDEETLADAQQQKLTIVSCMETEFTVESLLKAKGFADAAVTFHKGSVNVMLKNVEALTSQEAAQVLDIVVRETGENAKNVKISTVK